MKFRRSALITAVAASALIASAAPALAAQAPSAAPRYAHIASGAAPWLCLSAARNRAATAPCDWSARSQRFRLTEGPRVRTAAGLCMTASRRKVIFAACGAAGQRWRALGTMVELGRTGKCLTAPPATGFPTGFGPAYLSRCSTGPAGDQVWTWSARF